MSRVAALILAAGEASRFRAAAGEGGPASKLVASLEGKPLVRHVADAALASRARPVVVVTGHARNEVEEALAGTEVTFVHNADYAKGMSTSLKAGIAALPGDCECVLVLLADMPRVASALLDAMAERFAAESDLDALVPVYRGLRGNPVLLARSLFEDVATLTGDKGARGLIERPGVRSIDFEVADEAVAADVDTPEALAALRR